MRTGTVGEEKIPESGSGLRFRGAASRGRSKLGDDSARNPLEAALFLGAGLLATWDSAGDEFGLIGK